LQYLSTVKNQDPDVQFNPQGYLVLATAAGADQLMTNYNTQTYVIFLFFGYDKAKYFD